MCFCLFEDEEPRSRRWERRWVTGPRTVGRASLRELIQIDARMSDPSVTWYTRRVEGILHLRMYAREQNIFWQRERKRFMNKATARAGRIPCLSRWEYRDLLEGFDKEIRSIASVSTWAFHTWYWSTSILDSTYIFHYVYCSLVLSPQRGFCAWSSNVCCRLCVRIDTLFSKYRLTEITSRWLNDR